MCEMGNETWKLLPMPNNRNIKKRPLPNICKPWSDLSKTFYQMSAWKRRTAFSKLQPHSFISTYLNGKREQRERQGKLRSEWGTRLLPASSPNKRVAKKNDQISENGLSQCTHFNHPHKPIHWERSPAVNDDCPPLEPTGALNYSPYLSCN